MKREREDNLVCVGVNFVISHGDNFSPPVRGGVKSSSRKKKAVSGSQRHRLATLFRLLSVTSPLIKQKTINQNLF